MENKKDNCYSFFIYGCLFGIIIPTALLIIYDCAIPTFNHFLVKLILFLLCVIASYPLYAYVQYDKNKINPKKIDASLIIVGAVTIILIGFIVHFTGGMEKSMLSSYFFFIPSAIAIAFDANKSLKVVIPLALIAVVANLLIVANSKTFNNNVYLVFYILGISFQFLAIYCLEIRKNKTP
jgi:hypothetical protein